MKKIITITEDMLEQIVRRVIDEKKKSKKKKNVATNQKLWKQSLAWAKRRYEVCPSAYCNGAAVKRYNSKGGKWKKE
jgi:hypothetical protein